MYIYVVFKSCGKSGIFSFLVDEGAAVDYDRAGQTEKEVALWIFCSSVTSCPSWARLL